MMAPWPNFPMICPFSFFVGLRYTLSRKRSHLVSFISGISMLGMVLAVSVLITVVSVMNGFDRELRERILAIVPHLILFAPQPTTEWEEPLRIAQNYPGVVAAVPISYAESLVVHGSAIKPALLYGIDPAREPGSSLLLRLLDGSAREGLGDAGTVVLGRKLARKMGVTTGDAVQLLIPQEEGISASAYWKVVGLFDSRTELDEKLVLTHRKTLAQLKGNDQESVDGIRLYLEDLFSARIVAAELGDLTGFYDTRDWMRSNGNLYHAVQTSRKLVFLLVLIIIAVAVFNVVSTLVLAVNDKSADIAMLRTMGCSRKQVLGIFLVQGSVIGIAGVVVGVVLGVLLSLVVSDGVSWIEQVSGYRFLETDVYPIDHLPSDLRMADVAKIAGISVLLSLVASVIPAWRASRIEPAEVLRYE